MTKSKPEHRFDNPDLMPRDWMLAVMHDPHVSLITRIDIAARLMKMDYEAGIVEPHPHDREVKIVFRIETVLGNEAREPESTWPLNHGPELKLH
jgi:hypothetical protein